MGWNGMEWDGMGWDGMGWDGIVYIYFERACTEFKVLDHMSVLLA
jgi:hypothetical protein